MRSRQTQAAPSPASGGLYVGEAKIYPREVHGRFARLRRLAVIVLLGLFYGAAWLPWNGRQALLFDLPARKFYIFGLTLWPQDFFYLALLLIICALSLFFFTALAGRLWCGYACPQTVWTELFIWIEQWTEGTRTQRMKLDSTPWSAGKILRKSTKQLLWVTLALYTGFTFVGYFVPIRALGNMLLHGSLGGWSLFWVFLYSLATYGNAGFLREQVCKYMCPYARFQSSMFDHDTLIISYDAVRGEPRGGRSRHSNARQLGLGDCIDCTLCVQACPTGIDIRQGLQYECIACAACIDACDEVMDKVGSPRGLIRYTTERALLGGPSQLLRPRLAIYSVLLLALAGTLVYSLSERIPLLVDVLRDRNALYRELNGGDVIENSYQLKIINEDDRAHRYRVDAAGLEDLRLVEPLMSVSVSPGSVVSVALRLQAPAAQSHGVHTVTIDVVAEDESSVARRDHTRFLGPVT